MKRDKLDMTKTTATVFLILLLAAIYAFAATRSHAAESDVSLYLDQAQLVRLPSNTVSVILGNPLIADIGSPAPGGVVVVTAKSYGRTNIIFADKNGDVIAERQLIVRANSTGLVTVTRGASDRQTYACNPACQPMPQLGDSQVTFKTGLDQIGARNGASQGVTNEKERR